MNLPSLDFKTIFPYKLDGFQKEAIQYLDEDKSVVVTAPTGSGKTLIGEYAIFLALNSGKRVFYTTPLKALSNQKFRDFQNKFGRTPIPNSNLFTEVGLITGDTRINPDAPVVVMTTEIYRNMLYSTPIGEVGTSIRNVKAVILDECHYISNQGRGTVWEESIIYSPAQMQLVALSATIGNGEQLCEWINNVRISHSVDQQYSKCMLIKSDYRPVPLNFHFSHARGLFALFNDNQKLNPKLKRYLATNRRGKFNQKDCPNVKTIVKQLSSSDMLPAIYIIFSRRGCDQAVESLAYVNLVTVEESKKILLYLLHFLLIENFDLQEKVTEFAHKEHEIAHEKIMSFLANNQNAPEELVNYLIEKPLFKERLLRFLAENSELVRNSQIEPLTRGIAAHHAGILPAWKELVERLFELGLVKIVFATATLAAGINMPARTTVISALKKRSDNGLRYLTPSEFLQIAGRAGRRGMDEVGYVITVQTPFEGALVASKLAKAPPEPLSSQFAPSYGMVLNLLQKHSITEVKKLLELSFAEYLAQLQLNPQEEAIASYTTEITRLDMNLASFDSREISQYEKLKERRKQEKKIFKLFKKNWLEQKQRVIRPYLDQLSPGHILNLCRENKRHPYQIEATFVSYVVNEKVKFLLCLGKDNNWYLAVFQDVSDLNSAQIPSSIVEQSYLPEIEDVKVGMLCHGDETTLAIANLISEYAQPYSTDNEEIVSQQQRINEVNEMITNHPLDKIPNMSTILKNHRKRQQLQQELSKIQSQYQRYKANSSYYWQEFMALIDILREFGALIEYTPTSLGEAAAVIRGENQLWLGLAFMSSRLDNLLPHHLAGVVTALITEPIRGDAWVGYNASIEVLDVLGLRKTDELNSDPNSELGEIRRKLYQAQTRREIAMPVWLERDLIGLSEAWCQGATWDEICANTTLDEGDIVRILRRTVDILMQIPQIPAVSYSLITNAKDASEKMKRFPI